MGKRKKYGLPYQGSKSAIAEWVVGAMIREMVDEQIWGKNGISLADDMRHSAV